MSISRIPALPFLDVEPADGAAGPLDDEPLGVRIMGAIMPMLRVELVGEETDLLGRGPAGLRHFLQPRREIGLGEMRQVVFGGGAAGDAEAPARRSGGGIGLVEHRHRQGALGVEMTCKGR